MASALLKVAASVVSALMQRHPETIWKSHSANSGQ